MAIGENMHVPRQAGLQCKIIHFGLRPKANYLANSCIVNGVVQCNPEVKALLHQFSPNPERIEP